MSSDGALFDIEKVNFFAREYIASLSATEVVAEYAEYAKYIKDEALVERIRNNYELFKKILNIERETPKPRKDYSYAQIYESIKFFFNDEFAAMISSNEREMFNPKLAKETIIALLDSF